VSEENAMDDHLDELIAAAAPAVARRTPELQRALDLLVAETESAVPTPHRIGRRLGVVSIAAAALLSVGAGASFAGIVPTPSWAPWYDDPTAIHEHAVLSTGTTCNVSYAARPFEEQGHPVSRSDRAAAVAAAQEFLGNFDLSTISVSDAVRKWRAARAHLELPPEEPEPTPDELELLAVQAELSQRLRTELERQGLSTHAVDVAAASRCDDGTRP
jgi:hypothetical protein